MKTIFAAVLGVGLAVGAASVASADIYMAGDSTMCNYNPAKQYPQQGWGRAGMAVRLKSRNSVSLFKDPLREFLVRQP